MSKDAPAHPSTAACDGATEEAAANAPAKTALFAIPPMGSRKEAVVRIAFLLLGYTFMALGVDLTTVADLGTSPVSAMPYVFSLNFSLLSFGGFMIVWQGIIVALQVIILRRDFKLFDLLQIPAAIVFGIMLDVFLVPMAPLSDFAATNYAAAFVLLLLGVVGLALGVALLVLANLVMNCGEALVKAVCFKTSWNFGHMKVAFDLSCIALAAVCSFLFAGSLEGVREGSLICAAFTGFVVNFFLKPLRPFYEKLIAARQGAAAESPASCEDARTA